MIGVVREFFRGLKEREELDAILPELLTAMGHEVLSRPMVGTRQYGADVASIGIDEDGVRKLFLFSIKRGDLNRQEWDSEGEQTLRRSLNEIKDAYLRTVAPGHKRLPVLICITLGGVVRENILPLVNGYMESETTPRIAFALWTGDTLALKIVEGALREEVFSDTLRSRLRRAAALVDEPDAALSHFARLIEQVIADDRQDGIVRARILYLALWILAVWGREAGNLEAPVQASELVLLRVWAMLSPQIEADRGRKREASHVFHAIAELHFHLWDELYGRKILPHTATNHALSLAVWSQEPVDINLVLFKTAGRIAMGGLWRLWLTSGAAAGPMPLLRASPQVAAIAEALAAMAPANPVLYTPATEDQTIDLTLVLMLLVAVPETRPAAQDWVRQTIRATRIGYMRGENYPQVSDDYAQLIRPPDPSDEKARYERTRASILQPLLAIFARGLGDRALADEVAEFQTELLDHCNFQTWVPNARSEAALWTGGRHGASLGSLKIGKGGDLLAASLAREIAANTAYADLSTSRLDHWPVLLTACRCYRLPPPPQLWLPLLDAIAQLPGPPDFELNPTPVRFGGVSVVRALALRSVMRDVLIRTSIRGVPAR